MTTARSSVDPIVLRTRGTQHVLACAPNGTGLRAGSWGPSGAQPAVPDVPRINSFATLEDLVPHEYSVAGTRQVAASDLLVHREDGTAGARVSLADRPVVNTSHRGDRLEARLRDEAEELQIDLSWESSTQHDVLVRRARVTNTSVRPVTLARATSGTFCLHLPHGAEVTTLTGDWSREYDEHTTTLTTGTFSLGSRQGVTSHRAVPVVTLSDPEAPGRGCWAFALAWSGSWGLTVDATDSGGWVRVSAGACDTENPVRLDPQQSFEAPALLGLWAPDRDAAARAWHRYARLDLLRDTTAARRPITYNSWYATGFDVRFDQQLDLARTAAGLGVEMFVLDDGWFRGRSDDTAGLGDWYVDNGSFPEGLTALVDEVHRLGMRFGLWIEPEGVNPNSDLFREHPDWIHRSPDREPPTMRHQYVLDLGRPEVEQWCLQTLRRVLTETRADHLKWDMNRAIGDAGRGSHGREWALQHTAAYHRILDALREEFPQVTLEACAGGGGRVSTEVLRGSDVVWASDETGPRDRLTIQHGYLSAFPAATMSSWVTELDGMRDSRPASVTYRAAVSLCGAPGIGSDLTEASPSDLEQLQDAITWWKDLRPLVFDGEVQRHGDPRRHGYAVEFAQVSDGTTPGGGVTDPRVLLVVFGTPDDGDPIRLRPRFCDQATRPEVAVLTAGGARWDGTDVVVDLDQEAGAAIVTLGLSQ